jgi:hypothetical protein
METINLALRWIASIFEPDEFARRVYQDEMLSDARNRLMSRYY